MAAELFITEGLFILLAGNIPLSIHQSNANGFHLFPAEPVHSAGTFCHAIKGISGSAVPCIAQFHARFNAVGNIVVVSVTGLVLQVDRIQRQDFLVLNVALCRNVYAAVWERQVGKSVGSAGDLRLRKQYSPEIQMV